MEGCECAERWRNVCFTISAFMIRVIVIFFSNVSIVMGEGVFLLSKLDTKIQGGQVQPLLSPPIAGI